MIDRFGWDAAHNGPLGEMRRMLAGENVYKAYQSRENYRDQDGQQNWVEWAEKYPISSAVLQAGMMAASEVTDGGDS